MSVAVWSGTWDFKEITKEEMRLAKIQDDMDRSLEMSTDKLGGKAYYASKVRIKL